MAYASFDFKQTDALPHAEEIGRIALTWDAVHGVIFELFFRLSGWPRSRASAVFYELRSDLAQRAVTIALLRTLEGDETASLRAEGLTIFSKIGKFAEIRNGAVHALLLQDQQGFVAVDPHNLPGNSSRRKDLFKKTSRRGKQSGQPGC